MGEAAQFFEETQGRLRLVDDASLVRDSRAESAERCHVATRADLDDPRGSTAPSPFDTVLEGLCGGSETTFVRVARQNGLDVSRIDFRCSYAFDPSRPRSVETGTDSFNRVIVEAQVHTDAPEPLFDHVVLLTEALYSVESLMSGSGVELRFVWRRVSNI